MYLDTNVSALFAENSLTTTMGQLSGTETQIATGNALADPATNPSESAIVALSQGHLGTLTQAAQNVAQGIDLLNTANGAVQNDVQIVQQMQALAVQASSGTNTAQDRADLQSQVSALLDQIDHNSQVSYNGLRLLGGGSTAAQTRTASSGGSSVTPAGWVAEPWQSTSDQDDAEGQYGHFSNLTATNLPKTTPSGAPAQYLFQAILNPGPFDGDIYIASYPTNAETHYVAGDTPDGLVLTLTQATSNIPESGTITVSSSDSTADRGAFAVQVNDVVDGSYGPWDGPTVSLTFSYSTSSAGTMDDGDDGATVFGYSSGTHSGSSGTGATDTGPQINPLTDLDLQIGGQNRAADQSPIDLPAVTAQSLGLASVSFATQADAQTAITTIQGALSRLTTIQGGIGAHLDQLQAQATNLGTSITQGQASQGTLANTNLASATAEAARQQVLLQTGLQALTDANKSPDAILSLLRAV